MQLLIRHKYIMISPTHRHRRIFMHTISRKYPNKYSNILKAQRLKKNNGRYNEDHGMIGDVQQMPKSREKPSRKTQNMP
jgi:hypothetical protein